MYAALLHCSEGLVVYRNEHSQSGSGARCGCNHQIGINIAGVSIFFRKYLRSNEIPSLKWAEHNFSFSSVFLGVDAYVKTQILLRLGVFFL